MVRVGQAPFLECSTRGDRRFSAFCAKIGGASIEEWYQASKIFADGSTGLSWRQAKGRKAANAKECAEFYRFLWQFYITEHPELLEPLLSASGLSDMFGKPGGVCQAVVLWEIRLNALEARNAANVQRSGD